MSFLYCNPNVLVIKDQYEIILNVKEQGVCYIKVGRQTYYASNTGIMPSISLVQKIRLPQKQLDKYKKYTVCYKKVEKRKSYFPLVDSEEQITYEFKPIEKQDNVNVIYVADIHSKWAQNEKVSSYFGDNLDLFIVNGDFAESESEEKLREFSLFVGNVTQGKIPALVGRGNHDTRGAFAEKVTEYMATDNGRAYFDFTVGPISGVVIDCGEDKYDNHPEYNSLNFFEQYRKEELKFLKKLKLKEKTFSFAVCHIPFMTKTSMVGEFDIMPSLYEKWGKEVDRLGIEFMICGHQHKLNYFSINDERNKFDHSYPVIVGANLHGGTACSAITLKKSGTTIRFIFENGEVGDEFTVKEGYKQ